MPKPKVLILTSSYPKYKGDINGNFVYELATRLKSEFEIFILTPAFRNSLNYDIIDDIKIYRHKQFFIEKVELAYGSDILAKIRKNLAYLFVVPFYLLYQFISLRKIVKNEKIQIIHAHWLIPQGFLAVLYKTFINTDIKIVATAHGADINSFDNFIGKRLKGYILKRIDQLTVVSNALKEKAIGIGYNNEVHVFPMGIDTKLFTPDKKDNSLKIKYKISGNFLLFVGGIIERKGIRYLIQAIPAVIKKFPGAKLLVIGEGNLSNEMSELAESLSISNNIIFIGPIPHVDLPPYFATADVFILPSLSEGFGLVIIEAMSCGTIPIATDLAVIHDIIQNNITGIFIDIKNPIDISQKIINYLSNKEKLVPMKVKAREFVVNNFDWEIVKKNYSKLLSSL
jgi:glycosyltransferase involved in cell wall biosynthesis